MMKEMAEEEKQRIAEQRKELGEDGLSEKEEALENATDDNEVFKIFPIILAVICRRDPQFAEQLMSHFLCHANHRLVLSWCMFALPQQI